MFMAPASFGFTFSCEDKGGINPPTGQLRIQLTYRDHGANPLGSSFSIQGTADEFDPVQAERVFSGEDPFDETTFSDDPHGGGDAAEITAESAEPHTPRAESSESSRTPAGGSAASRGE